VLTAQLCGRARFAQQARARLASILFVVDDEELDRNELTNGFVPRSEHDAHPAGTE
jgi:hypothetical protein